MLNLIIYQKKKLHFIKLIQFYNLNGYKSNQKEFIKYMEFI